MQQNMNEDSPQMISLLLQLFMLKCYEIQSETKQLIHYEQNVGFGLPCSFIECLPAFLQYFTLQISNAQVGYMCLE